MKLRFKAELGNLYKTSSKNIKKSFLNQLTSTSLRNSCPMLYFLCYEVYNDMNLNYCSRDHKAVGRRPFDKMATLLAYLGPPEHRPLDSQ